jgi:hypothetical protein
VPYFLVRSDEPTRSDAIVLFVGPDFVPRKQEAVKLIQEGYARFLIIPEYGKVLEAPINDIPTMNISVTNSSSYPGYYERTHIEVLEAKKTMDKAGFKSVMFVSSPYQMRRISILARKVFGQRDYQLTFVPSRYVAHGGALWILKRWDLTFVTSEYTKMVWLMIYRFFVTNDALTGCQPSIHISQGNLLQCATYPRLTPRVPAIRCGGRGLLS